VSKTAACRTSPARPDEIIPCAFVKTGPVWRFTTSGTASGGGLPAPWLDRDIGSVGVPGSAQFTNGTFRVQASGSDTWGAADAFRFAYQPWSGDGSIVARVAGVTNTSAWAKAGVMFRSSLDAGSAHAFMLVSTANGVSFQRRPAAGGPSVSTNVAGVSPPRWVRLDRSGNTFTASYSSDGTTWTLVGTDTITMPQDLSVGMAVTSHNNTTLTTATLDSVTVSPGSGGGGGGGLPTGWAEQDVGSVGLAGSAQFSNGTFTVKASGADIWGTADAFHYVYQQLTGDGSIVARVGSVMNTNAWAKAGVMFRETLGAGSRHAFMLLSAANGVSFVRRTATGGTSVSTTVAGVTASQWVRLDRSLNTFTAYHSSDGTTWTLVGTQTITMPASIFVGMAVTSHNNTGLTAATFTNVTPP
jgi:regulation of enolase protein 1 (concanavalin A-like superfamily)